MVLRLAIHRDFLPRHLQDDPAVELGQLGQSMAADPLPDSARISAYLASGHELFSAMGARRDVVTREKLILGADSLRTDGTWLWREDLRHYFDRYHVLLPDDFVALVRERRYAVPSISPEDLRQLSEERRAILSAPKPG
ncbi:hypothetical protein [Streptomyces sp. NPDC002328]|uniref:hypothetical protein n=1 Tax=Streptomyces sp. NPDC002328 TaxID=3364642 RepID=UPI0036A88F8E